MRHSHPRQNWRVRFGVLRQPTASDEGATEQGRNREVPGLLRLAQGGRTRLGRNW
jgi:hypothetical protein